MAETQVWSDMTTTGEVDLLDEFMIHQGVVEKRILVHKANSASWCLRNNKNWKGDYEVGLTLTSYEDIVYYGGLLYSVISTATLPYTLTSANPSGDSNIEQVVIESARPISDEIDYDDSNTVASSAAVYNLNVESASNLSATKAELETDIANSIRDISDSTNLNSSTTSASSKAVRDLNVNLTSDINALTPSYSRTQIFSSAGGISSGDVTMSNPLTNFDEIVIVVADDGPALVTTILDMQIIEDNIGSALISSRYIGLSSTGNDNFMRAVVSSDWMTLTLNSSGTSLFKIYGRNLAI